MTGFHSPTHAEQHIEGSLADRPPAASKHWMRAGRREVLTAIKHQSSVLEGVEPLELRSTVMRQPFLMTSRRLLCQRARHHL